MKLHKNRLHIFPELQCSARLAYEKLNSENAQRILGIFSQDPNEFIIPEFKEKRLWEKYIDWQLNHAPFI